ncbi:hypothetical protein [Paenibacillus senegalensis]|uniref:hypothetical protein n=1 Tax=Paenibacillus senegalensis TaxID=1465766 RepID=UPI0002896B77|nr:hypothetical protein [Paenibacillus senegalensis]
MTDKKNEEHLTDRWFASAKEQEYYTKIIEQTSEETAGIPTPPDQEHMAATDGVDEFVEKAMDQIQETLFPEEEEDSR